ncbi:lytic transglycosylase domain-containing protein [Sphingopyxis sp.]|uniref:lytic transglycosylase domain-containing protein n=1 Tax=Sphingopyxis sp. TaxID=1908224 RepID=UPI003D6D402B
MVTARRPRFAIALHGAASIGAALAAVAMPAPCLAAAVAAPEPAHPYAGPVAEAAQRFGIPELWIWRVMHAESRGKQRAVSHAGAMGLMQIMPATWSMLSARHGLGNDPFDVRANILAGAAYLRAMWDRYRDIGLMLAAYNAGPGRADAYAAGRRGLPAETVAYVGKIAPELGIVRGAPPATAPALAPPGWRVASLFAPGAEAAVTRDSPAAVVQPDRNGSASLPHSTSAGTAQSSLFVPLSGAAE